MADITMIQAFTIATASVGAVLGILNTWRSIDQSRVKLKVVPKQVIPYGAAPKNIGFCVEVTNLSLFPVTVDDAGVFFHGTKNRASIIQPVFTDNGSWPRRLEPRSSVSIYSELPYSTSGRKIRCAFVRTQCGRVETGTSPALRAIAGSG